MSKLELILSKFKVEVYRSRHRETGYEMCITDGEEWIYAEITEEEYNLWQSI